MWSPNENYALIAAAGEITMGDMAFVNLQSGQMTEIHFQDYTHNEREDIMKEVQDVELETIVWLNPTTFQARIDVHCNLYEIDECANDKILRSYNVQMDLRIKEKSNETQRTQIVATPKRKERTGIIVTQTDPLLIRDGAGKQYQVIAKVPKGEKLIIIEMLGEWYQVRLNNGIEGYAYSQFIKLLE